MAVFTLEDAQIVWTDKSSDICPLNLNSRRPHAEMLSVLISYDQENVNTNQYISGQRELALGSSCVLKAKWPPHCTCIPEANFSPEENICWGRFLVSQFDGTQVPTS